MYLQQISKRPLIDRKVVSGDDTDDEGIYYNYDCPWRNSIYIYIIPIMIIIKYTAII